MVLQIQNFKYEFHVVKLAGIEINLPEAYFQSYFYSIKINLFFAQPFTPSPVISIKTIIFKKIMKKIALFLFSALMLTGCSLDDDGTRIAYQYSKISETDLPESFEKGKSYTIKVTYLLPTACHTAAGIEAKRGNTSGSPRRDIYIVGVSRYDENQAECNREDDDLEKEASFSLFIDEDEPYTFYLWNGYDDDSQSKYIVVEVPVL